MDDALGEVEKQGEKIMKFSKWIKPGTSEVRIYIAGENKAYLSDNGAGGWKVNCHGLYNSQLDALTNRVEDELAELNGGERFYEFAKVLELVK